MWQAGVGVFINVGYVFLTNCSISDNVASVPSGLGITPVRAVPQSNTMREVTSQAKAVVR